MRFSTNIFLVTSFLLLSVCARANDQLIQNTVNLSSNDRDIIVGAFQYINSVWSGKPLISGLTQKYFAPDITFITNGKLVYVGYTGFDDHLRQLGQHMKGSIQFPLNEVIQSGNKLVVRYNLGIYDEKGKYYPVVDTSIFTINNNRIQKWDEIVYSPYLCSKKASRIVYAK